MALLNTVKIAFGFNNELVPTDWNKPNANYTETIDPAFTLLNDAGLDVGWSYKTTKDFAPSSTGSTAVTTHFPNTVLDYSYKEVVWNTTSKFKITGLNQANIYTFYAAYSNGSANNAVKYTCVQAATPVQFLNNEYNGNAEASWINVSPNTNSEIEFEVVVDTTDNTINRAAIGGLYIEENGALIPPDAPVLTNITVFTDAITTYWTATSAVNSYEIERTLGDGITGATWSLLGTALGTDVLYNDLEIVDGTQYAYRIRGNGNTGYSAYSNILSATSRTPSSTVTKTITVDQRRPIADFYLQEYELYVGDTAILIDASVGMDTGIDTWEWTIDLGPGITPFTSTLETNVQYTFDKTGQFNVTLKVTNSSDTNTVIKYGYIQIVPAPIYAITKFQNYPVIRTDQTLKMQSTTIGTNLGYEWEIEYGTLSSTTTSNTYANIDTPGVYWVRLRTTNASGGGNTIIHYGAVTVLPVPSGTTHIIDWSDANASIDFQDPNEPNYKKITPSNTYFASPVVAGDEIRMKGAYPAGFGLKFEDFIGTAADKISVVSENQIQILYAGKNDHGIYIRGCHHFILDGLSQYFTGQQTDLFIYGFKVDLDDTDIDLAKSSENGCNIGALSTDIDVCGMDINLHTYGFAGIIAKTSPSSKDPNTWKSSGFLQKNTHIFHNRIANTEGEGFYIGHFTPGFTEYNEQSIPLQSGLVYNNITTHNGWDGFQLSSHTGIWKVFNNTWTDFGMLGTTNQKAGYSMNTPHDDPDGELHIFNNHWTHGLGPGLVGRGMASTYIFNNSVVNIADGIEAIYFAGDGYNELKEIVIANNTLESNRNQLYINFNYTNAPICKKFYIVNNAIRTLTSKLTIPGEDPVDVGKVFVVDFGYNNPDFDSTQPEDPILNPRMLPYVEQIIYENNVTFDAENIGTYGFYDFSRGLTQISTYSPLNIGGLQMSFPALTPNADAAGVFLPVSYILTAAYNRGAYTVAGHNNPIDVEKEKDLFIFSNFKDWYNNDWELKIKKVNFEGSPFEATLAKGGVQMRMTDVGITDPIKSIGLNLSFVATSNFQFLQGPYSLADFERQYLVELVKNGDMYYSGFIIPEQWTEEWLAPPYIFNVIVNDGLKYLERKEFILTDFLKQYPALIWQRGARYLTQLSTVLRYLLNNTGLTMDYRLKMDLRTMVTGFLTTFQTRSNPLMFSELSYPLATRFKYSWNSEDEAFVDQQDAPATTIYSDNLDVNLGDILYDWQQDTNGLWTKSSTIYRGYHYIPEQDIVFRYGGSTIGVTKIYTRGIDTSVNTTLLQAIYVDVNKFTQYNCKEALEHILQALGCQITQVNNYWTIQQIGLFTTANTYQEWSNDWLYSNVISIANELDINAIDGYKGGRYILDAPKKSQKIILDTDFKKVNILNGNFEFWDTKIPSTPFNWIFLDWGSFDYPTQWRDTGVYLLSNGQIFTEFFLEMYDNTIKIQNISDDIYFQKDTRLNLHFEYAIWDPLHSKNAVRAIILWDLEISLASNPDLKLYYHINTDVWNTTMTNEKSGFNSLTTINAHTLEGAFREVNEFGETTLKSVDFEISVPPDYRFLETDVTVKIRLWQPYFKTETNIFQKSTNDIIYLNCIYDNVDLQTKTNNQKDKIEFEKIISTNYFKKGEDITLQLGDVTDSRSLSKLYRKIDDNFIGTASWYRDIDTTYFDFLPNILIEQILSADGIPVENIKYTFRDQFIEWDSIFSNPTYLPTSKFYIMGGRYNIDSSSFELTLRAVSTQPTTPVIANINNIQSTSKATVAMNNVRRSRLRFLQ